MNTSEVTLTFHWQSDQDLLEEDASLSLGWLDITSSEHHIALFAGKQCMLMLTLTAMLDFLINAKKGHDFFHWVGEDGGNSYRVEIRKQSLKVHGAEFDLTAFKQGVFHACNSLKHHLQTQNPSALLEACYLDYEQSLQALSQKL